MCRVPTPGRLGAVFAPPVVAPTHDPDVAAVAALFADLIAAAHHVGTPAETDAFERRLGRAMQVEIRCFLAGMSH
jgi:hypothetical protein